jgi:hypothetical protein
MTLPKFQDAHKEISAKLSDFTRKQMRNHYTLTEKIRNWWQFQLWRYQNDDSWEIRVTALGFFVGCGVVAIVGMTLAIIYFFPYIH